MVRDAAPQAQIVESGTNSGFPAACNLGASTAAGDLLVFLNPDAVVAEGWREAIAAPLADGSGWVAWQALVTAERGQLVNTRGGMVHFTGIAWAGGAGEPVDEADSYRRARVLLGSMSCDPQRRLRAPRRLRRGVLPLPRGRRPLAARPPCRRHARRRFPGAGGPHVRVRQGAGEVALPRAQPLGDARSASPWPVVPTRVIALNCVAMTDKPDGPPGQAAVGEEVALDFVGPGRPPDSIPDDPHEVGGDDEPVEQVHE